MNGELLARLRETAGIKAGDLAFRRGMQPSRLSTIENGRLEVSQEELQELADTIEIMRGEREREHTAARKAFRRALSSVQAATR